MYVFLIQFLFLLFDESIFFPSHLLLYISFKLDYILIIPRHFHFLFSSSSRSPFQSSEFLELASETTYLLCSKHKSRNREDSVEGNRASSYREDTLEQRVEWGPACLATVRVHAFDRKRDPWRIPFKE